MKNLIFSCSMFMFGYSSLYAQDLRNTEWICVKAEKKDGSEIADGTVTGEGSIKYLFKSNTVLVAAREQYANECSYSVQNNKLSIGNYLTYSIDTVNNIIMVLTEIPKGQLTDDKINKFVFINNKFLFEYLRQENLISIIGDTLIQCDKHFSPTYNGQLEKSLKILFSNNHTKRRITGSFIIETDGHIAYVEVDSVKGFDRNEKNRIKRFITSTEGSWVLPKTTRPFGFKIDFAIELSYITGYYDAKYQTGYSAIKFSFHTKEKKRELNTASAINKTGMARSYFKKGVRQFNKGQLEYATVSFVECIKADPTYFDAYYELAVTYVKLGHPDLACEMMSKLMRMGQVPSFKIYDENCK